MKCPYRMNEVHTCCNGKTWVYSEFADCYGGICPYFDASRNIKCQKVINEIGCHPNQEVR